MSDAPTKKKSSKKKDPKPGVSRKGAGQSGSSPDSSGSGALAAPPGKAKSHNRRVR